MRKKLVIHVLNASFFLLLLLRKSFVIIVDCSLDTLNFVVHVWVAGSPTNYSTTRKTKGWLSSRVEFFVVVVAGVWNCHWIGKHIHHSPSLVSMHGIVENLEPLCFSSGAQFSPFDQLHRPSSNHHFYPSHSPSLSMTHQRLSACGIYSIAWSSSFPFLRYSPHFRPFLTNKHTRRNTCETRKNVHFKGGPTCTSSISWYVPSYGRSSSQGES